MQEREGGSAAEYRCQLGALHALRGAWRRDPSRSGFHRLPRASRLCKSIGRPIWRVFLAPRPRRPGRLGWARVSVPGTSVASLCVRPRVDCLVAPSSRSAYWAPAGDNGVRLPAARASAGAVRTARDWSFPLLARGGRALVPRTSPVFSREEPGATLQAAMKSWQLIAVVGDAVQVRREEKALNAVREGEEREREGWRAGSLCKAFLKPTDSREGVEEGRGPGAGDRGEECAN